ncbi:MAG TPA: sigma-70 family RNA polymerase sigma factor [Candidatus Ozemobacteraceae bacterium]
MPEITDTLIDRARAGDRAAFAEIYRAHAGMVYGVALRMSGSPEVASEIAQDVFVAVFRKLDQFHGRSALKTWIYRITVNTALNARKKHAVERGHIEEYMREQRVMGRTATPCPEERFDDRVQELLSWLPEEQRVCLLLRSVEQLSYQEIADVLEINLNTVRTRLRRARETLFAKLRGGPHEL